MRGVLGKEMEVVAEPEEARKFVWMGVPVLVIAPGRRRELEAAIPGEDFRGLIMLSPSKLLIVPREGMARTFYPMRF